MKKAYPIVIMLALAVTILASGCTGDKYAASGARFDYASDEAMAGKLERQKAPGFDLPTLDAKKDGKRITLEQYLGKPVVLNFWASWCIPCKEEAKLFGDTHRKFKDQGVIFVGIDVRDTKAEAKAFVKKYKMDYPIGFDPSSQTSSAYRVGPIPITFFIDKEGYMVARWFGPIPEDQLNKQIQNIITK